MNFLLAYIATNFYTCVSYSTDAHKEELVRTAFKMHDTIGPADFDKVIDNAVHHLAILSAVKKQKEETNDESVATSQEESPVAGRDHKE